MKRRRVRVRTGPEGISYWAPLPGSCSLLRAPFSAWESAGRLVGSHRPYLQRWGFSGLGGSLGHTLAGAASGHLAVSGALGAPCPRLPRPAASSPPRCSASACGPCGFPHPCWLLSSAPCSCSLSRGESLASAGLAAALLEIQLVSSCPPCCSCHRAALVLSASGVRALQGQEGSRSLIYSVSRFIEEKTAAVK